MIINKSAYDRGFGDGSVYKTKILQAADKGVPSNIAAHCIFTNIKGSGDSMTRICKEVDPQTGMNRIDDDGLPVIGTHAKNGDPICVTMDHTGKTHMHKYKDDEP